MNLFVFPYLSAFSQLVVVLVVVYCRKQLTLEMKILAAYFVLGLAFDFVQVTLARNDIPNLWVSQTFTPIQFVLLMLVFYFWNKESIMRGVILALIPVFILVWTTGSAWFSTLATIQSYMDPISGLILILISSYTLLRIERLEGRSVLEVSAFWVSSATIIYFGGTVVLSSLSGALLKTSLETMRLAWSMQSIATILANLMFSGGFLCLRQKT